MKQQALYVGKKEVKEPARTGKNGEMIPEFNGVRYTFYVNEWGKDGKLEDLFGRIYTDKRADNEKIEAIENGTIQLGDLVEVTIRKSDFNVNFYCRLNDEMEDCPF